MRQVSTFTIIGNGKVATHFLHYLTLLGIACQHWYRNKHSTHQLIALAQRSSHIFILITDSEINHFIEKYQLHKLKNCELIHFSGALNSKYACGIHPLFSFGQSLYDLSTYQKIPFILDQNKQPLNTLIPGINNPSYIVQHKQKAFYHALCVMANNFSALLWKKFFDEMQQKFTIKKQDLLPYLEQTFLNLNQNIDDALTGPLQRQDHKTLTMDLQALANDKHQQIFQAFINVYGGENNV